MSKNIENLTESSTNLGIVKTTEEYVEFDSAVRSSVMTLRDDIVRKNRRNYKANRWRNLKAMQDIQAWEYKKNLK